MIKELRRILIEENLACIIKQYEQFFRETDRGVSPIIKNYNLGHLKDAYICDKVIGKASAMFIVAGQPKVVHGMVISQPAMKVFETAGVEFTYDKLVKNIINRDGTDLCPMEKSVLDEDNIEKGLCKVLEKVAELRSIKK
ncbi:MAG: DUF1893 domain-containing protein [Anaerovoracaceae bacterium]